MSFKRTEKDTNQMGRSEEKSDSESDNEGTTMMTEGNSDWLNRSNSDSDLSDSHDFSEPRLNTTAKETSPVNPYSRKNYPSF